MMRRKVIRYCVLVLLLIVSAVLAFKTWDHFEDRAEFCQVNVLASKIIVGMEFSEVTAILGDPWGAEQVHDGLTRIERFWPQKRYALAISFRHDKVSDVHLASIKASILPIWLYELLNRAGIAI
jgi:hypothetical protein